MDISIWPERFETIYSGGLVSWPGLAYLTCTSSIRLTSIYCCLFSGEFIPVSLLNISTKSWLWADTKTGHLLLMFLIAGTFSAIMGWYHVNTVSCVDPRKKSFCFNEANEDLNKCNETYLKISLHCLYSTSYINKKSTLSHCNMDQTHYEFYK